MIVKQAITNCELVRNCGICCARSPLRRMLMKAVYNNPILTQEDNLMKSLYHTYVANETGLPGTSYVASPEGLSLGVSSPLTDAPGTNPEQLIGLALATCLNATLHINEANHHQPVDAAVRVRVDMAPDTEGYQFFLHAEVRMPQHDHHSAQAMLALAQRRCPVAKLVGPSANVTIELVDEFSTIE